MNRKISLFSVLASIALFITLILGIVGGINLNRIQPVTAASVNSAAVGRIIFVENDSQITAGKLLYSNDTLEPKMGANIIALCYASGDTWNVPAGNISRVSDRCQPPTAETVNCSNTNGCYPDDPRGPIADFKIPYIISPFETDLINNKPPISWHAVAGITNYSVRVTDITGAGLNWERLANNPAKYTEDEIRWNYPGDVPTLEAGHEYKLTVEAQSLTEPGESTFATLKSDEIEQVQNIVNKIDKLNLTKEEKALQDLYSVYKGKNLISEIREILESLVKEGNQTAQVYRKLGDIYLKQGLLGLAQSRYETAVKLAKASQDMRELKAAQNGIEQLNARLNKATS